MTRLVLIIACILSFAAVVVAQDNAPAALKIYAGFSSIKPEYNSDHVSGVEIGVTRKVFSYDNIRLEATGSVANHFAFGGDNFQFVAGPQVSADFLNGRVTPFVRGTFGLTRVYSTNIFTKAIGGGVDIKLTRNGRYFIRPFQYDRQWLEGGYPITANRFGVGGGITF